MVSLVMWTLKCPKTTMWMLNQDILHFTIKFYMCAFTINFFVAVTKL